MSGPMVVAYGAGSKTQTRRLSTFWLKVNKGDRFWFREAWGIEGSAYMVDPCLDYRADGRQVPLFPEDFTDPQRECVRRAFGKGWRSPIHMPRWAARYTPLVVADARLERLQDISEEDLVAEGMGELGAKAFESLTSAARELCDFPRAGFHALWDSLHNKPGEDWKGNPMVVVLEFEGVKR